MVRNVVNDSGMVLLVVWVDFFVGPDDLLKLDIYFLLLAHSKDGA